jgi:mannitol/fructose-specific phosphotransferase system IIA component (Ntr-type)
VINELVHPLVEAGAITEEAEFVSAIVRRENMESTGIGLGVAIPHARTRAAVNPTPGITNPLYLYLE